MDLTGGLSEPRVFPASAEKMISLIEGQLARGDQGDLSSPLLLHHAPTGDLQSVSHDEHLHDQRDGGAQLAWSAMGGDSFRVGKLDFFRLGFERNAAGRVVRLEGRDSDGRTDGHDRVN